MPKTAERCQTMAYKARILQLDEILEEDVIDLRKLKRFCFQGIPDEAEKRALCWKLLLNYMPLEKQTWSSFLAKKRELYKSYIEDLIVIPGSQDNDIESGMDHPLNIKPDSAWQTYFKDNEVLLQIDKDVRRLCPDISFFQQACDFPCKEIVSSAEVKRLHTRVQRSVLKCANVERKGLGITKIVLSVKKAAEDYAPMAEGQEAHWEVVERILFLYAKLNPGQSYVQGMNEIIGPIYYTFASDPDLSSKEHAEADCFFCFTNLMSEIRDFFIKSLDEAEGGINNMMSKLVLTLKNFDISICEKFSEQKLFPQYYSFRWITLLLSQEFALPDVLQIWDSLFSDERRFQFLIYICCAMIILCREKLIEGDFPSNLKLLQNVSSLNMDIQKILSKAVELSRRISV